jgi:hypothetical protein
VRNNDLPGFKTRCQEEPPYYEGGHAGRPLRDRCSLCCDLGSYAFDHILTSDASFAPASIGDTQLLLGSMEGLSVGDTIRISFRDSDSTLTAQRLSATEINTLVAVTGNYRTPGAAFGRWQSVSAQDVIFPGALSYSITLGSPLINAYTVGGIVEYDSTPVPTVVPTEMPSATPSTAVPTAVPTEMPTAGPTTATPTTASPTEEPSAKPTSEPTKEPSAAPTESPTEVPSATPTESPTKEPSFAPTDTSTEANCMCQWAGGCLSDADCCRGVSTCETLLWGSRCKPSSDSYKQDPETCVEDRSDLNPDGLVVQDPAAPVFAPIAEPTTAASPVTTASPLSVVPTESPTGGPSAVPTEEPSAKTSASPFVTTPSAAPFVTKPSPSPLAAPTASTGDVCVYQQCRSESRQQYGLCAPGLECVDKSNNGYYAQCREPSASDCQKSDGYCIADSNCCGDYSECRGNACVIPCGTEVNAAAAIMDGSSQSNRAGTIALTTAIAIAAALVVLAFVVYYCFRKINTETFHRAEARVVEQMQENDDTVIYTFADTFAYDFKALSTGNTDALV